MELGLELWSCGPSRVWVVTDFGKLHLIHGDGKKHAVLRYETTSHYTLVQGASENDLWSRAVELNVKGREALSDPMRGGAPSLRLSDFASDAASASSRCGSSAKSRATSLGLSLCR